MTNEFEQWTAKVIEVSKENMTEATIAALGEMDDKKLGGMLIKGYVDKHTPTEMALILADAL